MTPTIWDHCDDGLIEMIRNLIFEVSVTQNTTPDSVERRYQTNLQFTHNPKCPSWWLGIWMDQQWIPRDLHAPPDGTHQFFLLITRASIVMDTTIDGMMLNSNIPTLNWEQTTTAAQPNWWPSSESSQRESCQESEN